MGLDSYWNKVRDCESITVKLPVEFKDAEAANTFTVGQVIKLADGRLVRPRIAFDIVDIEDFENEATEKDVDLSAHVVPLAPPRAKIGPDQILLEAAVEGDFKICGGMLSGHGNSSFRGKVYDRIVTGVTGVSLYTDDRIPNETVREMARKLAETPWREARKHDTWEITEAEYDDLVEMFKAHAEAGHVLTAWY